MHQRLILDYRNKRLLFLFYLMTQHVGPQFICSTCILLQSTDLRIRQTYVHLTVITDHI